LLNSIGGFVTLYPTPSYLEAYPVKMFEYMASGLGVIASNFPLYKSFIEDNRCGICVNPLDINEIREAIKYFINNKNEVKEMGARGKKMIKEKYCWEREEEKLFEIYEKLEKEKKFC